MAAIFKREMRNYFTSPIGYIVVFVYFAVYGFLFSYLFSIGNPDISIFSSSSIFTMVLMPILTMRLFSEERRQKTDQALFTAPVSIFSIVMGKFFAAICVFAISQSITLVFQLIFAFNVTVDWVNYFSYLIGTLLMASSLISIGMFISALTDSQIVSAIGSLAISFLLVALDFILLVAKTFIASISNININSYILDILGWISFTGRYQTYFEGIFDIANTVFFISFTAIFIFLTVRVQESKRWA